MPLLLNLTTWDQTREPAILKLERHLIGISTLEIPVRVRGSVSPDAEALHAHHWDLQVEKRNGDKRAE